MELLENKIYTNEELAEWFKVKPATFVKSKKKKLEYLKQFAEFEEVKGKVKIIKVIEPVYINPRDKKNNDKLYRKDIETVIKDQPLQYYKTCAGRVMQLEGETKKLNHRFSTTYKYVRENLPKIARPQERVWCRRFWESAVDFIPLTKEQQVFWKEQIKTYMVGYAEVVAEYKSQEENGELSKEETQEYLYAISSICWEKAKQAFYEVYHFTPVSVNRWELTAWAIE